MASVAMVVVCLVCIINILTRQYAKWYNRKQRGLRERAFHTLPPDVVIPDGQCEYFTRPTSPPPYQKDL